MIVALVALFVSLAGNAGAVTYLAVTSKQIKDGTIQLRDIAPAARTSLRGSPGPQGSRGSRGSRGCRATEVQAGPAGKSFDPYQLERDLGELCPGIRTTQNALPSATYLYPSFRYRSCTSYYY